MSQNKTKKHLLIHLLLSRNASLVSASLEATNNIKKRERVEEIFTQKYLDILRPRLSQRFLKIKQGLF